MQSRVCNRCPIWARCGLTYGGKACHNAAKEAGFIVKPTNYERIADMDIDEMARFIVTEVLDLNEEDKGAFKTAINGWKSWLESEVVG